MRLVAHLGPASFYYVAQRLEIPFFLRCGYIALDKKCFATVYLFTNDGMRATVTCRGGGIGRRRRLKIARGNPVRVRLPPSAYF